MEENSETQEDLGGGGKFKNWLQDNIRIVLSVLIVATIAAGIYSYSNRTVEVTDNAKEVVDLAKNDKGVKSDDKNSVVVVDEDNNKDEKKAESSQKELSVKQKEEKSEQEDNNKKDEEAKKEEQKSEQENKTDATGSIEARKEAEQNKGEGVQLKDTQGNQQNLSEETDESFVETAIPGDSLTTLARRAVKNYLEKNPTDGLTAEHKVYIEDYLRRTVQHSTIVRPGETISFSKSLISQAITASKNLNARQLKNLQKYSSRVSGL